MLGLVPGIDVFCLADPKTWMAGMSPAMTNPGLSRRRIRSYFDSRPMIRRWTANNSGSSGSRGPERPSAGKREALG
ncbi:hypothetical protein SAMN05443248_4788 [Bradyrhizobium erythrophlei]|uniref:Uncharacterized protein n=1 Tax=Bradyrhizobium erythrophlei TaxID=1437360 RepID=A0A1M5SXP4_9BRAD|nr:hypothetical protein SAMN05443248_4788 [Bradyrhizobium erythrophlei]